MRGPTLENVCCRVEALEASLGDEDAGLVAEVDALQAPNTEIVYAAGTADAIAVDGTQVAIDLGTTDPAIVIGVAGTYLIQAQFKLDAAGMTITTQTASFKLARTNNTPADIAGSDLLIDLPVMTTLTHTLGVYCLPPILYTTTNDDDAIALFGAASAALGAGTLTVTAASIVAIKLG